MGDEVRCKAVLAKSADKTHPDELYLAVPPDFRARTLPCRPRGEPKRGEGHEWEYVEQDGKLALRPSLLATDSGFHTDYDWNCDYELRPKGVGLMEHFNAINPGLRKNG